MATEQQHQQTTDASATAWAGPPTSIMADPQEERIVQRHSPQLYETVQTATILPQQTQPQPQLLPPSAFLAPVLGSPVSWLQFPPIFQTNTISQVPQSETYTASPVVPTNDSTLNIMAKVTEGTMSPLHLGNTAWDIEAANVNQTESRLPGTNVSAAVAINNNTYSSPNAEASGSHGPYGQQQHTPITRAINGHAIAAATASAFHPPNNSGNTSSPPDSFFINIPESVKALQNCQRSYKFLFNVEQQRRINTSLTTMQKLEKGVKVTTRAKPGWILADEPNGWFDFEGWRRARRGDSGTVNSDDVRDVYLCAIQWVNEAIDYQTKLETIPHLTMLNHLSPAQLEIELVKNRLLARQLMVKISNSMEGFSTLDKTYNKDYKKSNQDLFSSVQYEIDQQLQMCCLVVSKWTQDNEGGFATATL